MVRATKWDFSKWMQYDMKKREYLQLFELKFCSQFIQKHPFALQAYCDRGQIYFERKEYSRAIKDYSKALSMAQPDSADFAIADAYSQRASAYMKLRRYDHAIRDFKKAVQLSLKNKEDCSYIYISHLADCYEKAGQYALAIKTFKFLIKKRETSRENYQLARIYASCKDVRFRSGIKAVFYAKKALRLEEKRMKENKLKKRLKKGPPVWNLDVLAAAYAQAGQFKKAIEIQKEIAAYMRLKYPQRTELIAELEHRLKLYMKNVPYIKLTRSTASGF